MKTPIVDSHVHFWDPDRLPYPWLEQTPQLRRAHGRSRFDIESSDFNIHQIVFVECTGSLDDATAMEEVAWIENEAGQDGRIAGVVAHASLEFGEAERDHLEALTGRALVRGVRRLIQGEADDNFCVAGGFVEGVQLLAEFSLSFDACIYHFQMPALVRLAQACPDTTIILDHIGKPAIRDGIDEPWRADLAELASCANVSCKISGVLTEDHHDRWTAASVLPYIEHAIGVFGPERIMFGSDWPVVTLAGSYAEWIEVLRSVSAAMSEKDRQRFFSENARRIYRLHS